MVPPDDGHLDLVEPIWHGSPRGAGIGGVLESSEDTGAELLPQPGRREEARPHLRQTSTTARGSGQVVTASRAASAQGANPLGDVRRRQGDRPQTLGKAGVIAAARRAT